MEKGINLRITKAFFQNTFELYSEIGRDLHDDTKNKVLEQMLLFDYKDVPFKSEEFINSFFPIIEADVFISYAHIDSDLAMALAGWLKKEFNITTFVDECLWAFGPEILEKFDKSLINDKWIEMFSFISNFNIIITQSLSNMIDKCPLFIFLNTENSNFIRNGETKTFSPWLYHEINMSSIYSKREKLFSENMKVMEFKLNLNHLIYFSDKDLSHIHKDWKNMKKEYIYFYKRLFKNGRGGIDFLLQELQE